MSEPTVQDFQRLLTEAIHKQMIILGSQITLLKVHTVPGLTVSTDGTVTSVSNNPKQVATQFLEQFRDLSSPLVRKTMQPLLSAITPPINGTPQISTNQPATQPESQNQN
jgi:hypothetical protein